MEGRKETSQQVGDAIDASNRIYHAKDYAISKLEA